MGRGQIEVATQEPVKKIDTPPERDKKGDESLHVERVEAAVQVMEAHHHVMVAPGPHECSCGEVLDGWAAAHKKHVAHVALKAADAVVTECDAAVAAIERVRAIHRPTLPGYGPRACTHDGRAWPCPSVAALDGAPEPETAGVSVKNVDTSPERDKKGDDSLHEKRVEAAAREIWKADNTTLGIDPPESMEAWVEETDGYLELARAALEAADAVVTEEMIAEVPSRDDIIDALVMTDLSDYAGTDMGLIEQAADRVLALFRGGVK